MLMGVCCTFALFIRQIRKEGCRAFELSAVGEQTIKGSVNSQQRKTCELLVGNAIKWRMVRLAVNSSLGEGYGVGSAGCYKRCCWCNYQHYITVRRTRLGPKYYVVYITQEVVLCFVWRQQQHQPKPLPS